MRAIAKPEKAIILYNHLDPVECSIPSVDILCKKGCSGLLLLEGFNEQKRTHLQEIIQLLGVYGCTNTTEMKDMLTQRFGKMKFGLLSTSLDVVELTEALGFTKTGILDANTVPADVQHFLSYVDCLFVDATMDDTAKAWSCINNVVTSCLEESHLLKCVVTPSNQTVTRKTTGWRPQQSHTVKDGKTVQVDELPLICSYFHASTTRLDQVTQFRAADIAERGCNGKILAWHFLAEIGCKLGHVPKYGA